LLARQYWSSKIGITNYSVPKVMLGNNTPDRINTENNLIIHLLNLIEKDRLNFHRNILLKAVDKLSRIMGI